MEYPVRNFKNLKTGNKQKQKITKSNKSFPCPLWINNLETKRLFETLVESYIKVGLENYIQTEILGVYADLLVRYRTESRREFVDHSTLMGYGKLVLSYAMKLSNTPKSLKEMNANVSDNMKQLNEANEKFGL